MAEQANQSLLSEDLRMQLLGADAIDMHSNKGADSKRSQLKRQAGDSEELVLSGRKKKKGERGKIDSTEVRNLAQQISKKEAKRIKQIKQRKEREARKADFLQVIDSHKLSSSQQQLLISTRDIGQSLTTKKLLASLLRKHRAGLELTASEQELLFQQRNTVPEPLDSDLGFMLTDRKCEIDFKLGSINSAPTGTNSDSDSRDSMKIDPAVGKKAEESSALLISFDDLYSEPTANPKCADGNTRNSERSKKRRKKRQEDVGETANAGGDDKHNETSKIGSQSSETTGGSSKTGVVTKSFDYLESAKQSSSGEQGIIVAGSKSQSMGKSLLAQFKNLKNFPKTDSTSSTVIETVSSSSASMCSDTKAQVEVEEGAAASQEGHVKPYKPQQIVVPEMKGSATRQTLEKTCDTITNRETAGQAKSKKPAADDVNQTRPIVFREAEVNAQRLQLPVCGMEQEIVEAVKDNDVTILSGETGSGKSTQVMQLLEYCCIPLAFEVIFL